MSEVLPILGLITLAAIAIGGVTFAWRLGVSIGRILLEIFAVLVGGILAPIPFACAGLAKALVLGPFGRAPDWAWTDILPLVASAAGAVIALCLISPVAGRGAWQAAVAAMLGFAAAAGASFGACFLMQNSWCEVWLLLLVPLSIASATVGSYALATGGH